MKIIHSTNIPHSTQRTWQLRSLYFCSFIFCLQAVSWLFLIILLVILSTIGREGGQYWLSCPIRHLVEAMGAKIGHGGQRDYELEEPQRSKGRAQIGVPFTFSPSAWWKKELLSFFSLLPLPFVSLPSFSHSIQIQDSAHFLHHACLINQGEMRDVGKTSGRDQGYPLVLSEWLLHNGFHSFHNWFRWLLIFI